MDKFKLNNVEVMILKFLAAKNGSKVTYHSLANHFCDVGSADDCIFLGSTLRKLRKEKFILDELGIELTGRVYTVTKLGKAQI